MSKRVAILGGGVAGMSAAHELAERGFEVAVYEMREVPGGKARSMSVPGSGKDGLRDLPGEHGFRFFPGFYRHLPDTLRRIPYRHGTVLDNLVPTEFTLIAREGGEEDLRFPAQPPGTPLALLRFFRSFFTSDLGFKPGELGLYARRLLTLLISCEKRRYQQYEHESWLKFVEADVPGRSDAYQKYCADGITRTCVACQAHQMSARTGGYILLQLLFDFARPGTQANRVLNGPTNDVWIQPWLEYLRQLGVDFRTNARVKQLHFDKAKGLVTGVTVQENGSEYEAGADYYIAALPVEVMEPAVVPDATSPPAPLLTSEMKEFAPSLRNLAKLTTEWMNGVMFYLRPDVPVVKGHVLYIDSKWALTSISQKQFWPHVNLKNFGDGTVEGVLSVDISDWNRDGDHHQSPARRCSPGQIKEEVWKQIERALNDDTNPELDASAQVRHWFLDTAIRQPNPNTLENAEPLLINKAGTWEYRPRAKTEITNFFLAADYVRTFTDLATMEAANEAARWAVNWLLKAAGSTAPRCKIWRPSEPWVFAPLRWYDRRQLRKHPTEPPAAWALIVAQFVCLPLWLGTYLARKVYYLLIDRILAKLFGLVWSPLRWAGRSIRSLARSVGAAGTRVVPGGRGAAPPHGLWDPGD